MRGIGASFLKRCWLLYLICLFLFGTGFAWGVHGAYQLDKPDVVPLEEYVIRLVAPDATFDRGAVFRQAAVRNTVPVGVMYFAGLTIIGVPVVAGILFVRGYAIGFTSGFLVRQKGIYGLSIVLAELLPQNLLLVAVFLVGAVASLSFSLLLFRRGFNPETAVFSWFLRYTGLMVLLSVIALGAGVVEAYMVPVIARVVLPLMGQ